MICRHLSYAIIAIAGLIASSVRASEQHVMIFAPGAPQKAPQIAAGASQRPWPNQPPAVIISEEASIKLSPEDEGVTIEAEATPLIRERAPQR